jgi:paraquat-inducible protein A
VLVTIIVAPLVRIVLTIVVLGSAQQGIARPGLMARLLRLRTAITPWSMPEVFLLGVFVAYTRIGALAPAQAGVALFALGALVFAKVTSDALLDEYALWERIRPSPPSPPATSPGRRAISCRSCGVLAAAEDEGGACPRCGAVLHRRRPYSVARTWAFLIAATCLYAPANFLPIMTYTRYARATDYTILGGAVELLDAGQWPLALLVFLASVCVPVLKIVGLLVLLVSTHLGRPGHLRDRTHLYRIIEVIGRWSMIDVFMISILTAIVQIGQIANVIPRAGAPCFAAVVVLTMLAAGSFDPRLMWDAASTRRSPAMPQGERRLA